MPRIRTSLSALVAIAACASATGDPGPPRSSPPPPSAGHSLIYADDLELVLLVNAGLGGATGVPAASTPTRVWAWNGTLWQVLDSAGPPVRNLGGVAWDIRRHVLVMHGGSYDQNRSYDETWEWSRQSGWRRFTGPGPGKRDHTQLAYDPERGRAVLFGGSGADPNIAFSDTWEFDGTGWERVATAGPPGLVHHAMQYDPGLRRVVVFGGFTPGGNDSGDTWAWDGTRWTALPPATAPRTHARMAFHGRLNAMLAVGGFRISSLMLTRGASGWTPLTVSGEPSERYLPDVAYDTKRNVMVLFGGGDPSGTTLYDDTWEFDGTAWTRVSAPSPSAPEAMHHGMQVPDVMYHYPRWSPDERWIVAAGSTPMGSTVMVFPATGGAPKTIPVSDLRVMAADWTPKGDITFMAHQGDRVAVFVMDRDGRHRREVGRDSVTAATRDSSLLLFEAAYENVSTIYAMDRSRASARALTRGAWAEQGSFSPDGRTIVFERRIEPNRMDRSDVVLMSPTGADHRVIASGTDPSWSPDGRLVLYKEMDSAGELWVAVVDPLTRQSRHLAKGVHPQWSPSGTRVLYMVDRPDHSADIYVIPIAGGEPACVTCRN